MFDNLNIMNYSADFLDRGKPHTLVDVRTSSEFAGGHLPDAINIPLQYLEQRTSEIPTGKPVVVVCASGNRSQTGASILKRAGFDQVYNLEGGTMLWMMQGKQIVR